MNLKSLQYTATEYQYYNDTLCNFTLLKSDYESEAERSDHPGH